MISLYSLVIGTLVSFGVVSSKSYFPKTSEELQTHLASATGNDRIFLLPQDYEGEFVAKAQGRPNGIITLFGSRDPQSGNSTIMRNPNGAALTVSGSYWSIAQIKFEDSLKGIFVQNGRFNRFEALLLSNIEEEAYLFENATENIVRANLIKDSRSGIVLRGTSNRNTFTSIQIGPTISRYTIDIGPESCCGLWRSNLLDSSGHSEELTGSVKVFGDSNTFMSNLVKRQKNGFEVEGCENKFHSNYCDLDSDPDHVDGFGYCIYTARHKSKEEEEEEEADVPTSPPPAEVKPCRNYIDSTNYQSGGAGISNYP